MSKGMKSLIMTVLIVLTIVFYFIAQIPEQLTLENGFYEDENIMLQVYKNDRHIGIMKYNKEDIRTSIQSFPFSFSRFSMGGANSLQNFSAGGLKHGFYLRIDDERYFVNDYSNVPRVNSTEQQKLMDKFFLKMEPFRNPEYVFQDSGFFKNHFFAAQVYEQGEKLVLFLSKERSAAEMEVHYGGSTIYGRSNEAEQIISVVMAKTDDKIIVNLQIDEIKHQITLALPENLESIPEEASLEQYKNTFLNNISYY